MSSTEGKRRQYKMPVWVLCVLFLLFESPTPSTSQLCSTEKIENMIIDIESALQYGVRGTEPIYSSMEDHCINLCCAEEQIEGQKTCNFVIFDKTKTVGHPNCYMFNCPLSAGACPMKPSEGMNSYKLIQDFPPGAQDSKKNVTTENSKVINVIDMHLDTDRRNQAEQENVKRENIPGPGGDDGSLEGVGRGGDDGHLGGVGPGGDNGSLGEDGPVEGLGLVGGIGAGFRKAATTVSKESMASVKPSATSEAKTSKITILPATTMPKFAKTVTTTTSTMIKPSATNRTIITSKSTTTTEPPTTITAKPTTTTPTMTNTTTTTKPRTTATNPTTTSTKQTTTTTTTGPTSTTPTMTTTTKPTTTATNPTTTSTKETTTTTTKPPTTTTKPTTTTPAMTMTTTTTTTTTKPTTTATYPTTTSTKQTTTTTTTTKATSTTPTTTTKPTTTATSPTTTSTKQTTTTTTTKPTTTTAAAPEQFATIASVNLAPKDSGRPNPAKPNLKAASGQAENLQDGMKSGLIADLVFGVMFMALVVGLLSQKAIESFKRRHYSRVDYLVNGMYIDT